MTSGEDERTAIERELSRIARLRRQSHWASAVRGAQDVARRSLAARHLNAHMLAQFEIANCANHACTPVEGCDGGMAFIALVESAERRTRFEPDYSQDVYERHVARWHVPVYHLLASEMAEMRGYNSTHMRQCVADGMDLCRRIGSPYVMSFHELASDTTRAAGEIAASLTYARRYVTLRNSIEDRRWASAKAEMQTLLVAGRFEETIEAAMRALGLAWEAPVLGRVETTCRLHTALALLGRADELEARLASQKLNLKQLREDLPPRNEALDDYFTVELGEALTASLNADYASAIRSLADWETLFDQRKCLHRWFEARLRRIAAQKISGDSRLEAGVTALADELTRRAEGASDVLSLRRLEGIFDASLPPSPYPIYAAHHRPLVMVSLPTGGDAAPFAGACATGFSNPVEMTRMPQAKNDNLPPDPLAEQLKQVDQLRVKCLTRSALRLAEEVRRTARARQRLIPFLGASFDIMNISQSMLEPALGRDAALAAIALLESADSARAFQSDYDAADYERYVQWMSACSYDNLAVAVARMNGYNSEGMQACIADGIAVCRRTGKMRCVTCFRDYASDVFRAADDLAMAAHHAQANAHRPVDDPRNDRRWVGAHNQVELALFLGELDQAMELCRGALELAPLFHSAVQSEYMTAATLVTMLLLAGKSSEIDPRAAALILEAEAPIREGENPEYDLDRAKAWALAASLHGQHDAAIDKLAQWDRTLLAKNVLSVWFEVRLRLIAAHRFAGRLEHVEALSRQLESKAGPARDFLTLRRLKLMADAAWVPCPFPTAAPFTSGPFAALPSLSPAVAGDGAAGAPPAATTPAGPAAVDEAAKTPLFDAIVALGAAAQEELSKSHQEQREPQLADIIARLLALGEGPPDHPHDAAHLIFLATRLSFALADLPGAWDWARALGARFSQDASVQSVLAEFGNVLRSREGSPMADLIKPEELEAMFRLAMDKDPNRATIFARAAGFYLGQEDLAKAEQCLARSSRLDRSDNWVAQRLAEVYRRTDRASDALAVLDLCIREGHAEGGVLYDAAMVALGLKRNELVVTYLDALEKLRPGAPWVPYYQAQALLDLGRVADAEQAIEREAQRAKGGTFHVTCTRAAIAAAKADADALRQRIGQVLSTPFFQIENLTAAGIAACMARVWTASAALAESDPALRTALEDRCLASALIPDGMLLALRQRNPRTTELRHFICIVDQPLDSRWKEDPARLPRQDAWKGYRFRCGVLAKTEDDAREVVLSMQRRCCPLAATIESIDAEPRSYNDHPGLTWREYPEAVT